MSKQHYIVNKTDTHLQLKRGFLHIPRGGYRPVSAGDLEHSDIVYAKDREWIEVTDVKPEDAPALPAVEVIDSLSPLQGMTAEELAAQSEKEAKVDTVTSEAIGKSDSETGAPKKGRKAAAEKAAA